MTPIPLSTISTSPRATDKRGQDDVDYRVRVQERKQQDDQESSRLRNLQGIQKGSEGDMRSGRQRRKVPDIR